MKNKSIQSPMRLAKKLAQISSVSRRGAEEAIAQGRVSVNGQVVLTPVFFVQPDDKIQLDNVLLSFVKNICLWRCYKPVGCLVTCSDPFERDIVFSRLDPALPDDQGRIIYVGRLDQDSEGLLLLTNHSEFAHKLERPVYQWTRRYHVALQGHVPLRTLEKLEQPLSFEDVTYPGCKIWDWREEEGLTWIRLELQEGKKREIRQRMRALGCRVERLIRTDFGPFTLEGLTPGRWDMVPFKEVEALQKMIEEKDAEYRAEQEKKRAIARDLLKLPSEGVKTHGLKIERLKKESKKGLFYDRSSEVARLSDNKRRESAPRVLEKSAQFEVVDVRPEDKKEHRRAP